MNPRSLVLSASMAAMALAPLAAPAGATSMKTRNCDPVTVSVSGGKGTAHGIRATGTACSKARTVVRSCLRDSLHGWRVSRAPSPDDRNPKGLIGLDRGLVHVSFQITGRGGCA
jgi:hypothetical protein